MTAPALFDVLKDFGTRPQTAAGSFSPRSRPAGAEPATPPQPSAEEIVRAEVAKAEAALEERLAFAHAAELEVLRQEHATEIDGIAPRHRRDGRRDDRAPPREMEERIGDQAATASRPHPRLLPQRRIAETLDGEPCAVDPRRGRGARGCPHRGARTAVAVRSAAERRSATRPANFGYVEAPGFDLSVTIDGNLFETRLSEWSADPVGNPRMSMAAPGEEPRQEIIIVRRNQRP